MNHSSPQSALIAVPEDNADPLAWSQRAQRVASNLNDYLRVMYRFKWGVIGLALIGILIGAFKAYSETPIYQASATMLIERQAARFVPIEESYRGASSFYDFGEYYQTQYEILKSRSIAERTVELLGLEKFRTPSPVKSGFSLSKLNPLKRETTTQKIPDAELRDAAIGRVQGNLQLQPIRNSQLVRLVFRDTNPVFAAEMANTHAKSYIEDAMESRVEMSQTAATWLNERMSGLRAKLDDSERKMQEFRDREKVVDLGGGGSVASQELSIMTERLSQARRERIDKETLYRQVQSVRASGGRLDSIPSVLAYPLVSELKDQELNAERDVSDLSQRYGPLHPKLQEAKTRLSTAKTALDRRLAEIADGIGREYQVSRLAEGELSGAVGSTKGELRETNRKQYEINRMQREVDNDRQLFEMFQQRYKETNASGGVQTANARIVEAARPSFAPVLPNKRRMIMIGLFVGLALGIGLAFLLDHLDNTLKGPEDVEHYLQLAVLGSLPKLKPEEMKAEPIRQVELDPKSSYAEAVRTIRTGILLSAIDKPHQRVLVTSSVPGEGKTTLSMNLAQSLGQMRKTLVIDCDMRRPTLHHALQDSKQSPGLSELLTGQAKFQDCIRHASVANLFIMPAGVVPPNPLEILSSKRFEELLDEVGKHFEHIILDCAPACAVSDALVLSRLAHAVVYVVKSDSTPWQIAQSGVRRLQRVNAPLVGAVVNQITARQGTYGKYYYYADGYYSDYGYGHDKKGSKAK